MFLSSTHKSNFSNAISDPKAEQFLAQISEKTEQLEIKQSELTQAKLDLTMAQASSVFQSRDTPKERGLKITISKLQSDIAKLKSERDQLESDYDTYLESTERADVVSGGLYSENQDLSDRLDDSKEAIDDMEEQFQLDLQSQRQDADSKIEALKSESAKIKKYAMIGGIGLIGVIALLAVMQKK